MVTFFENIEKNLMKGQAVVLVTIVAGSGSTPRGAGAQMAVTHEGSFGTIGGGAVEFEAQKLAAKALEEKQSLVKWFDLSPNQVADLGMICGGSVTVYFQYIKPTEQNLQLISQIVRLSKIDKNSWMITQIDESGRWETAAVDDKHQIVAGEFTAGGQQLADLLQNKSVLIKQDEKMVYSQPLVRCGKVVIFGGGHITQQLVPVLSKIFFPCVVVDSHPDFAAKELFLQAREVVCTDFERAFEKIDIQKQDYIIIVTRGHQHDYVVLKQALKTEACYIGMIGSKKKIFATYNRLLKEDGFQYEEINRVHAPIGLDIGGETPEEIAISIAAQLIQTRTAYDS